MRSATPERIGEHNQKLILEFIRKNGPLSRADVSRGVHMSFPSVSTNISTLIEGDFVEEVGEGDNAIGRKSTLLAYNSKRGYVIGVDIGREQVRMLLADLVGNTILSINSKEKSGSIPEMIRKSLKSIIRRSKVPKDKILCVGLGAPGIIDQYTHKVFLAPFIEELSESDLLGVFTEILGDDVPVIIENSVNCGAIGEKWMGAGNGYRDILYVNHGVGVGSALILNGALIRGSTNAAGETGFMVPERSALRSSFAEEGVTEQMISGHAIAARMGESNVKTAVSTMVSGYREGAAEALTLLDEITDYIGMMLINTVSVVNPEVIIITGGVGLGLYDVAYETWNNMLSAHVPYPPKIVKSTLYNKANVLGAVAICLRRINESAVKDIALSFSYPE
jgi:predicted NBD/HSP70 family sugar kinase